MVRITQKGVALYLAIVIISILTGTLLTGVAISVSQLRVIETIGDSVIAFYAADTGIEEILVQREHPSNIPLTSLGEASYEVQVYSSTTPGCAAANYCVQSTGTYKNTQRAIEVTY